MYNDFIDTICQEINDHFHELTQDEVRTLIWRLGSFVEGKKQSPEFKEKVLEINRHLLGERVSKNKRVRSLLAFTSLCLNDQMDYQQFSTPELTFLAKHVDTLNQEQEEQFVAIYGQGEVIPLLCQQVTDDQEKSFYLTYYANDKDQLQKDLQTKPLDVIRKATNYHLSYQDSKEQIGGFYRNGSRRF